VPKALEDGPDKESKNEKAKIDRDRKQQSFERREPTTAEFLAKDSGAPAGVDVSGLEK
jgi:hypothetical protein